MEFFLAYRHDLEAGIFYVAATPGDSRIYVSLLQIQDCVAQTVLNMQYYVLVQGWNLCVCNHCQMCIYGAGPYMTVTLTVHCTEVSTAHTCADMHIPFRQCIFNHCGRLYPAPSSDVCTVVANAAIYSTVAKVYSYCNLTAAFITHENFLKTGDDRVIG